MRRGPPLLLLLLLLMVPQLPTTNRQPLGLLIQLVLQELRRSTRRVGAAGALPGG